MRFFIWGLILYLCILVALSSQVNAGTALCGQRSEVVKKLEGKYQEFKVAQGLQGTFSLFEVFASSKGTWTALVSHPDGTTCLLGAGSAFRMIALKDGDPT